MRNSLIWILSIVLSAAAHYGIIATAANIPLPRTDEEHLADIVLGGEAFEPASLEAGKALQSVDSAATGNSADLPEAKETLPSVAAAAEDASVEAEAATPQEQQSSQQLAASGSAELEQDQETENQLDQAGAAPVAPAAEASDVLQSGAGEAILAPPSGEQLPASGDGAELLNPGSQIAEAAPQSAAEESTTLAGGPAATLPPDDGATLPPTDSPAIETGPATARQDQGQTLEAQSSATGASEISAVSDEPQPTKVASTATATTQTMSQAERVATFMQNYGGRGCVLASADAPDSASPRITGLGGQGSVDEFAAAFRKSVGVDPSLSLDLVRDQQCPAVDFIRALGGPTRGLKVALDRTVISDGKMLIGHLEGTLLDSVQLLLVDDDGAVRDITKNFNKLKKTNFFGIPIRATGEGKGRNQLILALTSPEPVDFAVTRKPGEALQVFEEILSLARQRKIPVATAYAAFRIE
jgi:hypothetical protein